MLIKYRKQAAKQLASIYEQITTDNQMAASKTMKAIKSACNRLKQFPYSGRKGSIENTFELVVPRLPYIIVYLIDDNHIDIIGVFHNAQHQRA